MKIFEYENQETVKIYKELYKVLEGAYKMIKAVFKARPIINRLKPYIPENWHMTFYYSDCTESHISFWHNKQDVKEKEPSQVFKKLCDSIEKELGIKISKHYGEWDNKLETIQGSGSYGGYSICIYQYQVDQCEYFVEEITVKKVILTGDCINF